MITEKAFAENKVETGIKKLGECKNKVNQTRLDSFFKSGGSTVSSTKTGNKGAPIKGGAKNFDKRRT